MADTDLINVEEQRKAYQSLMAAIDRGDLQIHGMRLDEIMVYIHEIRGSGDYTLERRVKDAAALKRAESHRERVKMLEAALAEVIGRANMVLEDPDDLGDIGKLRAAVWAAGNLLSATEPVPEPPAEWEDPGKVLDERKYRQTDSDES